MKITDDVQLRIKAGNGGAGIVAWRREPNVPEGGPWGGEGGRGGHIYFVGNHNLNTLVDYANKKNIIAKNGENGQTQMASGHGGEDIYLPVPLGTSIYDATTNTLLCDILQHNQTYLCCKGGKGGHGNAYFKSSFNRIPSLHENGDLGEEKTIHLSLKYLADVGIVGLPNAGKSTLISKISNAKPKIANYPFTTLQPILGEVNYKNEKLVFADIPGLIEGSSDNKGLGFDFLRHIERCSVLIHMFSINPEDTSDIVNDYKVICEELKKYKNLITNKPIIYVANKSDCEGSDTLLKKIQSKINSKIITISAINKTNLDSLLTAVFSKHREIMLAKEKEAIVEVKEEVVRRKDEKDVDIKKDATIKQIRSGVWNIESKYLDYWFHKIPLDTKDNIIRFNQKIESCGVEEMALKMGANHGDTMIICNTEFVID